MMEQISRLENEIVELRRILQEKEGELFRYKNEWTASQINNISEYNGEGDKIKTHISDKLPKWAIERYSRQILLPDIGVKGQELLCAAKVLIVGAGGLGCPAAIYLAGAGVGEITIVDYDSVDITNIHRQFLHTENDRCMSKAESAANKLRSLNSNIKVVPYNIQLTSANALELASQHDLILDCTDNVPTRYLLSDTCVLAKVPLISGSALKMEGQLTIYGYRANHNSKEKDTYLGPCYRCMFATPPPAAAVGSCSSHGVAGPVPGAIGALQALEAIKYIVGQPREKLLVERMLIFDGEDMTFRTVKLRPRSSQCASCSETPSITQLLDYETFCQAQAKEKKKQESRLKSELRKREKQKRMSGQSYYGFRSTDANGTTKWIQDVPKSERKLGPPCSSEICSKNTLKKCRIFAQNDREQLFSLFWNLDWKGKKNYVRSLVDSVPVKRRRLKHKGEDLDLQILPPQHRLSPLDLHKSLHNHRHLLVDVRSAPEFNMCNIDGSSNYPIETLSSGKLDELVAKIRNNDLVTFICRRGNDSQVVAQKVLEALEKDHHKKIRDLAGGLHAWAKYVDNDFPVY